MAVDRVLSTFGHGDDADIAAVIDAIPDADLPDIMNLSFSGYTEDDQPLLATTEALRRVVARGTVVVASAGNDLSCRPAWPAALPEVVSVGALGMAGPAWFTNFGPWVRACAPGVDVVSRFFVPKGGDPTTLPTDGDGDDFDGWASWSGTSFAAPAVVGALAARMTTTGCSAVEAVAAVVDDPHLLRIPGLGTVVNVA